MPQQIASAPPAITSCKLKGRRKNVFSVLRQMKLGSCWLVSSPRVTLVSPEASHAGGCASHRVPPRMTCGDKGRRGDTPSSTRAEEPVDDRRVMDPLELRIVAPSALELPAPIPWPSPPKGPWPSTPKNPPGLTFTTLPNERNKEAPCNSPPVSSTPPTRGAPAREPATRTAVVPAERRKAAARSKRSTAESPVAVEAEEEGVRKSMRRWRRGKRERWTRSLIGRSEFVDWCLVICCVRFVCAMDNLCHVRTSRETTCVCDLAPPISSVPRLSLFTTS